MDVRSLILSVLLWSFFCPSRSAMECPMKTVLVSMGDNNRVVAFGRTSAVPVDSGALALAVKAAFSDVLLPGQTFFLQIKSEEWGGVFVDLLQQEVPDKSMIKAVVQQPEIQLTTGCDHSGNHQPCEKDNPGPNSMQLQLSNSSAGLGLRKPTAAKLEASVSPLAQADKSTEYIKEHSKIYGRNSKSNVTAYQQRINDAAAELCLHDHNLLSDRKLLLETARERVHESGYSYKKGSSRSKTLNPADGKATPKRRKVSQDTRLSRIAEVRDRIKDLSDQIGFKEKRRECASAIRNYNECDTLTEQMSVLKSERRQLEIELSLLTKKQSKSAWYHKKKRGSHSSDASSTDNAQMITRVLNFPASSSAMPQSSRRHFSPPPSPWSENQSSVTPSPASSRLTTPSPRPAVTPRSHFSPPPSPWSENQSSVTPSPASSRLTTPSPRPAVTPRSRFSPPLSSSESECPHDGDTIILSEEDDPPADFSSHQPLSFVSNPPPSLRRCEPIIYRPPTNVEELPASTTSVTSDQHFQ